MEADESPLNQEGPSPSHSQESDEEEDELENISSKYKLSLEQVDGLLKAIHETLGLEEERKELSLHDRMYAGLGEPKIRTFPVHTVISEAIKKEWTNPEKKPLFAKAQKKRFPFWWRPSSSLE